MIINGYEQYETLKSRMGRESHLYIPIYRDAHYHRAENIVLCVGIAFTASDLYIVSVTHDDAEVFDIAPTSNSILPMYANGNLYENGLPIVDISSFYSPYIIDTLNKFGDMADVNRIVPISVWANVIAKYVAALPISMPSEYMTDLISTLHQIENEGMAVDLSILKNHFDEKTFRSFRSNIVYSEYNPFTATGRPSNRFGHINFAALNKHDGTRNSFISAYPDGNLVQFDFEAYHLRLIADEFNIYISNKQSLHETFAKIYFNTQNITEELYEESKKKTFEILYGITPNDYGIELFKHIREFRNGFKDKDTVTLPSGITVKVDDPSPSKLFNYYIQSLETVRTLPKLRKVLEMLHGTNNHLTLYTYDSILLDMEKYDENLIKNIREILEENGKFPVRIQRGLSYGTMQSAV